MCLAHSSFSSSFWTSEKFLGLLVNAGEVFQKRWMEDYGGVCKRRGSGRGWRGRRPRRSESHPTKTRAESRSIHSERKLRSLSVIQAHIRGTGSCK
ncbi:unnamed protein product [Linum tenue]|uniref:Uncharacterized protein n=1 Tax=Linum tenue TaxID=586396 RepID=A0AAV0I8Q1_9ROSI|nr:unnamed protein product [Linum tenue]